MSTPARGTQAGATGTPRPTGPLYCPPPDPISAHANHMLPSSLAPRSKPPPAQPEPRYSSSQTLPTPQLQFHSTLSPVESQTSSQNLPSSQYTAQSQAPTLYGRNAPARTDGRVPDGFAVNNHASPAPILSGRAQPPSSHAVKSSPSSQQPQPPPSSQQAKQPSAAAHLSTQIAQLSGRVQSIEGALRNIRDGTHDVRMGMQALPTREEVKEDMRDIVSPALAELADNLQIPMSNEISSVPERTAQLVADNLANLGVAKNDPFQSTSSALVNHLVKALDPVYELNQAVRSLDDLPAALQQATKFGIALDMLHRQVDIIQSGPSNGELLDAIGDMATRMDKLEGSVASLSVPPPLPPDFAATITALAQDVAFLRANAPHRPLTNHPGYPPAFVPHHQLYPHLQTPSPTEHGTPLYKGNAPIASRPSRPPLVYPESPQMPAIDVIGSLESKTGTHSSPNTQPMGQFSRSDLASKYYPRGRDNSVLRRPYAPTPPLPPWSLSSQEMVAVNHLNHIPNALPHPSQPAGNLQHPEPVNQSHLVGDSAAVNARNDHQPLNGDSVKSTPLPSTPARFWSPVPQPNNLLDTTQPARDTAIAISPASGTDAAPPAKKRKMTSKNQKTTSPADPAAPIAKPAKAKPPPRPRKNPPKARPAKTAASTTTAPGKPPDTPAATSKPPKTNGKKGSDGVSSRELNSLLENIEVIDLTGSSLERGRTRSATRQSLENAGVKGEPMNYLPINADGEIDTTDGDALIGLF